MIPHPGNRRNYYFVFCPMKCIFDAMQSNMFFFFTKIDMFWTLISYICLLVPVIEISDVCKWLAKELPFSYIYSCNKLRTLHTHSNKWHFPVWWGSSRGSRSPEGVLPLLFSQSTASIDPHFSRWYKKSLREGRGWLTQNERKRKKKELLFSYCICSFVFFLPKPTVDPSIRRCRLMGSCTRWWRRYFCVLFFAIIFFFFDVSDLLFLPSFFPPALNFPRVSFRPSHEKVRRMKMRGEPGKLLLIKEVYSLSLSFSLSVSA